jgi:hypothetical protein
MSDTYFSEKELQAFAIGRNPDIYDIVMARFKRSARLQADKALIELEDVSWLAEELVKHGIPEDLVPLIIKACEWRRQDLIEAEIVAIELGYKNLYR